MPVFTVMGENDPFLHVSLRKNERIFSESGAMVMMEAPLQVKGQIRGGLGRALMRRFTSDESFFSRKLKRSAAMVIACFHRRCPAISNYSMSRPIHPIRCQMAVF